MGRSWAVDAMRRPLAVALTVSLAINILSLVSPLYLTQVYDRVISSRSEATLIALTAATLLVIALIAVFEMVRTLVFARAGAVAYASLESVALRASRAGALDGRQGRRARAFEDLEQVRALLTGPLPAALMDLVFMPAFVIILFVVHVAIGAASVFFAAILVLGALANRKLMARTAEEVVQAQRKASDVLESYLDSVESAVAMGYAARAEARGAGLYRSTVLGQMRALAATSGTTAAIRGVRLASQTLIVGLAASLAVKGEVSLGAIVACSILFSKALSPLDQVLGSWRSLFAARAAWRRLTAMVDAGSAATASTELPAPTGAVTFERIVAGPPGSPVAILKGISFALEAGQSIGIVGPSGSGKSTLARVMVGAWPTARGAVRFDGADIRQFDPAQLGRHIGYLPQDVALLPGTVADNIGRLEDADGPAIVAAAKAAGAHEMILRLPDGYDTLVGGPGFALSGGQRQRVGLARALYGEPGLVVLDEPDTGLDVEGEGALGRVMARLRARGATLVVIAHRPSLVAALDKLMVLNAGTLARFGPTGELLPQLTAIPGGRARA